MPVVLRVGLSALCGCGFEDWGILLCGSGGASLCGSIRR